jgi:hypothetical protein
MSSQRDPGRRPRPDLDLLVTGKSSRLLMTSSGGHNEELAGNQVQLPHRVDLPDEPVSPAL